MLAAIAEKGVKEVTYHRDYAGRWFLTLAQGTDESRSRLLAALPQVLAFHDELFTDHPVESSVAAAGVGVAPSSVAAEVGVILEQVFSVSGGRAAPGRAGRSGRRRHWVATAGTPRRSRTCSPRCSPSPAPTRWGGGDGGELVAALERARTASPPRSRDPEMPMLTLEDLGVLRSVERARATGWS